MAQLQGHGQVANKGELEPHCDGIQAPEKKTSALAQAQLSPGYKGEERRGQVKGKLFRHDKDQDTMMNP